jgi:hypothetical protein
MSKTSRSLNERIYLSVDKDDACIVTSFIVLAASRKIFVYSQEQGLRGFEVTKEYYMKYLMFCRANAETFVGLTHRTDTRVRK